MRYLPRPRELEAVRAGLRRAPVTALLGPRQCGKTTLAQSLKAEHFFDLEDPRSLTRLDEPQTALEGLTGTVVIDEVQRKPDLFPLLRVLADRRQATRYLLLGSALAGVGEGGLRKPRRARSRTTTSARWRSTRPAPANGAGCGSGEGSRGASWPTTTRPPLCGGRISSAVTWSATFLPSESPFRPRPCADSG